MTVSTRDPETAPTGADAPMAAASARSCPNCGAPGPETFFRATGVPTNSCLLIDDREAAVAFPRGDIDLRFCGNCGFAYNAAFDPERTKYSGKYEETQGFSPTFNAFHKKLAEELIARHGLQDKRVLEIGCGKGEFITMLCELGPNRGVGYDPSYRPDRQTVDLGDRLDFVRDFFTEATVAPSSDFVCCKMTLEHIPRTLDFVRAVRRGVDGQDDAVIFFQVPDFDRILEEAAFWDVYYEHCSYFSKGSLARLFRAAGFEPTDVWTGYGEQYLMIEAKPTGTAGALAPDTADRADVEDLKRRVATFAEAVEAKRRAWSQRLRAEKAAGRKTVIWGSGSKAVAFLTTVDLDGDEVEYVADINPHRHGMYMAGTGQRIVGPDFVADYRPDTVVVMNPIYRDEIAADLAARGCAPEILVVD